MKGVPKGGGSSPSMKSRRCQKVKEDDSCQFMRCEAEEGRCGMQVARVVCVGAQAEILFPVQLLGQDLKSIFVFLCGSDCFC